MNNSVFLLEHSYITDNYIEHNKTLGIFSTKDKAEKMISMYRKLPGFSKYPDNFTIDEYILDQTEWLSGFGIE